VVGERQMIMWRVDDDKWVPYVSVCEGVSRRWIAKRFGVCWFTI
jgi:hypothetical protein